MATNGTDPIGELWQTYLPRIEEAQRRDAERTSLPFCDLHQEHILDVPVVQLNIERHLILQESGVYDGEEDFPTSKVLIFLWVLNPDFDAVPQKGKAFFKAHRKLDLLKYALGIQDYLAHMFNLMPGKSSKGSKGQNKQWVAGMVDTIASEYGWPEKEILRIPLPRLFQYVTRISLRNGGSPIQFSNEADRIRGEFMEEANSMNKGVANG